jgi:uncharacterized protein YecE (DUF72 family)
VRIGCSGWVYRDWRGPFYPEKLPQREWLSYYAEHFDTVEINNTFYRLPSEGAVRGWVERTPKDFCFAVKASRYITHVKRLREPEKYVENFLARIGPLVAARQLSVLLWQLPPTFKRDDDRLAAALAAIRDRAPGRHAFEFRHPSWFAPGVYDLLRAHGVALAIADSPEYPFQTHELTADWTYVRLHRSARRASGRYTKAELETWKRRIAAWRARTSVVAYFNNDWEGFAIENARTLRAGLS